MINIVEWNHVWFKVMHKDVILNGYKQFYAWDFKLSMIMSLFDLLDLISRSIAKIMSEYMKMLISFSDSLNNLYPNNQIFSYTYEKYFSKMDLMKWFMLINSILKYEW